MSDIVLQSDMRPVSFEKQKQLTKGQKAIVDMLIQKAKSGEMLTKDDIYKLWLSVEKRYHRIWHYYGPNPGRSPSQAASTIELTIDNMMVYSGYITNAMQWFKNNLATCIIKGKILAIPVIEDE